MITDDRRAGCPGTVSAAAGGRITDRRVLIRRGAEELHLDRERIAYVITAPFSEGQGDARRDVFHRGGMAQGDVEESGLHRRVGIRHMQAGDAYHVRHSRSQARPGLVRAGSERERTTRASETSPPSRRGRGASNRFWGEAAPLLPQPPPPH